MSTQSEQFKNIILSMLKCTRAEMEKKFKVLKIDITPFQYTLLTFLEGTPMTLNDLANHTANKPPTLIPALDDLEKENYIIREKDKKDRRKMILTMTPKGIAVLHKIKKAKKSSSLEKGFESLGKQKSEKLLQLLEELSTSVIT